MTAITLDGCRTQPLGSYLQGLGAWSAITRLSAAGTRAWWRHDRLHLDTSGNLDALLAWFVESFHPLPVVSPWNSGSGIIPTPANVTATQAVNWIRTSTDARLRTYRRALAACDTVVAEARDRGFASDKPSELWTKTGKVAVIELCRNLFPDDALSWLDTAVVTHHGTDGQSTPTYSRLLGTGGNFGRQDLSGTYAQRIAQILADPHTSAGWLRDALTGTRSTALLRETVGQFDPGAAGGIQSSILEKSDDQGFANPWSFVLGLEGAMLFIAAAVRRAQSGRSRASLPFMVSASGIGYTSAAADETALGELWAPVWDQPTPIATVRQLLSEGRISWRHGQARNGLDAARAIASLGAERGISGFTRHVFAMRHGQNPLALPVGHIQVQHRPGTALTAQLDGWLARLRRDTLPAGIRAGVRAVDAATYTLATSDQPGAFQSLLTAVGRLHRLISRSGDGREATGRPLVLRDAAQWWHEAATTSPEWNLAAVWASGRDHDDLQSSLRGILTPVTHDRENWSWSHKSPAAAAGDIPGLLAAAHRRRASGSTRHTAEVDGVTAAVQGPVSGFTDAWHAPTAGLADVDDFLHGDLDDTQLENAVFALMLCDWAFTTPALKFHAAPSAMVAPLLTLLLPFYGRTPLVLHLTADDGSTVRKPVLLRPGSDWLPTLATGHINPVVTDAMRRLRISGIRHTPQPAGYRLAGITPDRLAAALLLPATDQARAWSLTRATGVAASPARSSQTH